MNFPQNIKSPRASFVNGSTNNQLGQVASLQQSLLQKDHQISNLQGTINRLEMKNKQYSSYQQAMVQYQQRVEEVQSQLLKVNEKLRAKNSQCDQLKKKLQQQLKQKKQRTTSYVKHDDYMKLTNEFKNFRKVHTNCQNSIKMMQDKKLDIQKFVQELKRQIQQLNVILHERDAEINKLKVEKYQNYKSSQSIQSQKQLTVPNNNIRSNNSVISSFKVVGQQNQSFVSLGDIQKINYQFITSSRENDQLRSRCHKLQQQINNLMNSSINEGGQGTGKYGKIIQQYEATITSMAAKLSVVHKLQMEKSALQQQKRRVQIENQQLRQDLSSRISYCEILEKKIRDIEYYQGVNMQSDIQNFLVKSEKLSKEVQNLDKIINEKYEKIIQLKKKINTLQITQQTFVLMDQNLNSLQQALRATKQQLKNEQNKLLEEEQKSFKLQKQLKKAQLQSNQVKSEMAKTNRLISQKVQKIEFQTLQIKRLEKQNQQKKELSQKLARLQVQYKKLDKRLQQQIDQSNELAMSVFVLSAEIQRRVVTGNITKQFVTEFQNLKIKSKQTEVYAKTLEGRVDRLQQLHKQVVTQSMKVSQHLHISHKRWNHYDTAMEKLLQFLQNSQQRSRQRYEQLDNNIEIWLKQQQLRLKQLSKSDALNQLVGDSAYVTYTGKITTQVLTPDGQLKEKDVKVMPIK